MQFSGGKKDKLDVPNNRLQMYKIPPTDTISLEEFEEFAIERLKGIN